MLASVALLQRLWLLPHSDIDCAVAHYIWLYSLSFSHCCGGLVSCGFTFNDTAYLLHCYWFLYNQKKKRKKNTLTKKVGMLQKKSVCCRNNMFLPWRCDTFSKSEKTNSTISGLCFLTETFHQNRDERPGNRNNTLILIRRIKNSFQSGKHTSSSCVCVFVHSVLRGHRARLCLKGSVCLFY